MEIIDDVDSLSIGKSVDELSTVTDLSEEEQENEKADINDNKEDSADVDLKERVADLTHTPGNKRKYTPSVIDFLINNNSDDMSTPIPTKLQCLDSSLSSCLDGNNTTTKSDVDL